MSWSIFVYSPSRTFQIKPEDIEGTFCIDSHFTRLAIGGRQMHLQPPSMHEIKYLEWVLLFSPPHPKPKWFRNRLKFYFVHSFIDLHLLNPITPIKFLKGHKCLGSLCVPKSQGSPFELSAYSVWTARNMWLMILNIFIGHNNKYSLISEDKLVLCISNHL